MATKKVHHKYHKHSPTRPVRIREVLITLVFGTLVLIFLTLTVINTTSGF